MADRRQARLRALARVVVAAALVAAGVGVLGAGSAATDASSATLQYTCTLSPFPGQPMVAQLTWNAPTSVMVGQATPSTVTVDAAATVGPTVTWALGVDGAATVEGSVDAPGTVAAPEGPISSALQLVVPRTNVPASGPMTFQASGTAPSLVFHQPGHATINVGSDLTMHLTLRDSGGNLTPEGQVDLSCTLDPGQNTVVFAFDITAVPAAQAPATTPTAAPVAAPTATEPPATATPPSPTSSATLPPTASTATSTPVQPAVTTATTPPTTELRTSDRAADLSGAGADRWLAAAGILAAIAGVIGGVWWYTRRRLAR